MKKFDIKNFEDTSAELYDISNLVDTTIDVLNNGIYQFEGKTWDELTDHQINMAAYNLYRDSGKLLTLLNIINDKLGSNRDQLEQQISGYYHTIAKMAGGEKGVMDSVLYAFL